MLSLLAMAASLALAAPAATTKVVLDDAVLRVIEHTLPPGGSEPLAHHGCRLSYALADHSVKLMTAAGTAQEQVHRFRSAWFRPAEDIAVSNGNTRTVKELIFEFKAPLAGVRGCGEGPSDATAPGTFDAMRVAGDYYKVVFENAALRVLESSVPPGSTTAVHSLRCRLSYALTDQSLRVARRDGAAEEQRHALGSTWWRGADEASIANLGTKNAFSLVVEFKGKPPAGAGC